MAEAVLDVLIAFRQVLQAAEHVALREILLGFTEILARCAEVLRGLILVVVAVVVVMATLAALSALAALAAEKTTQQVSDHWGREACESEHCYLPFR